MRLRMRVCLSICLSTARDVAYLKEQKVPEVAFQSRAGITVKVPYKGVFVLSLNHKQLISQLLNRFE